jgi:hypothetical protein
MATDTIQFTVDKQTAEAFRSVPEEERIFLRDVITSWLRGSCSTTVRSLSEITADASREAQARGLTPEILEEILRD